MPDDLRALGWDATLDEAWSALARPPAWSPGRVRRIDRGWSSLLSAPGPGEQPQPQCAQPGVLGPGDLPVVSQGEQSHPQAHGLPVPVLPEVYR